MPCGDNDSGKDGTAEIMLIYCLLTCHPMYSNLNNTLYLPLINEIIYDLAYPSLLLWRVETLTSVLGKYFLKNLYKNIRINISVHVKRV